MKQIKINIDDVRNANNSVSEAIEAWAENDDEVASGACGPRANEGVEYSAQYALGPYQGAAFYVDTDDGKMATLVESEHEEGEEYEDDVEWTDESQVRLEVPSEEDALMYPEALRAMALAVADYHSAKSDTKAWRALLDSIRAAAEAVDGIEIEE